MWKLKVMNRRNAVAMAGILIGIVMALLIMQNYRSLRDGLISNEQAFLLTLADSTAKGIESYFKSEAKSLKQLSQDFYFVSDFKSRSMGEYKGSMDGSPLAVYYSLESPRIDQIQLINRAGEIFAEFPNYWQERETYPLSEAQINLAQKAEKTYYGDIFFEGKSSYIHMMQPVFEEGVYIGTVRTKLSINHVYETFVAPIKTGDKGYASVKDSSGRFLMHPNDAQIGQVVLSLRKKEFPDFDWSELEDLFRKQMMGEKGVEIYHSVWVTESEPERVLKFNGYAPVEIGDDFWIVTVSADYNEVVSIIKSNYYTTIGVAAMIFLSIFSSFIFIYMSRQREEKLKLKTQYLEDVKELNIELEKDIEKRKVLEKQLLRTGNKYETLFNSNEDCILLIDYTAECETEIIEANSKAISALGYTKATLIGRDFFTIDPQMAGVLLEKVYEQQQSNPDIALSLESVWCRQDGIQIPVDVRVSMLELEDRHLLLLVSRDITKRKLEEEAVRRSEQRFIRIVKQLTSSVNDRQLVNNVYKDKTSGIRLNATKLENINRQLEIMFKNEMDENKKKEALMMHQSRYVAMGEMIGNIAHQWRQPLNALSVIISNFEDMVLEEEYDKDYLEIMFSRSRKLISKMSMTIDDFRYFFKPRSKKLPFNVYESILSTSSLCEERIRYHGISFEVEGNKEMTILGYGNQLSQVLLNLINNSVDAFHKSGIKQKRIRVEIKKTEKGCTIRFSDNAGGIPEGDIDQIFDPYYTTKEMRNGTGLGLYMSKMIIEQNFDGTIEVANSEVGACFCLKLALGGEEKSDDRIVTDVL